MPLMLMNAFVMVVAPWSLSHQQYLEIIDLVHSTDSITSVSLKSQRQGADLHEDGLHGGFPTRSMRRMGNAACHQEVLGKHACWGFDGPCRTSVLG